MTNVEIARVFSRIATLLEIEEANPFRVRAYREAARLLESHHEPIAAMAAEEGRLETLKGVGKDIAGKIRDVVRTGSTALYDELTARIPVEVLPLTELPGLGPKRVRTLVSALQVRSVSDLEAAARAGRLRELPGFGPKVEEKVLQSLASRSESESPAARRLIHAAWDLAHRLAAHVAAVPGVERVEIAGSFRRRCETIGDLDLLACGGRPEDVMAAFVTFPAVAEVLGRGDTKSSVRLGNGLQVDLRLVPAASFGAALLYFTGSKSHNIELRRIAIEKGWSLNEYGLTEGERVVASRTEEEIYRALGMAWIPPELREAHDEIARATAGTLPVLVEPQDLLADLHMHTTRSDGRDTLDAMVAACVERGYRYCAITEHSKALPMITGFDDARVFESAREIAELRLRHPEIAILHGLEVDILADGTLDLGEEALAALDWVIVSLHTRLQQPEAEMTPRVLRALSHPAVCVMGHPTARRIGQREPAAFDLDAVLAHAAERGVAMEINAHPDRTDLNAVNARLAHARGVSLVISTDAHRTTELEFIRYGLFAARRAGLTRDDVLNTLPFDRFEERLRARRPAKPAPSAKPASAAKPAPAGKPAAKKRTRRT